MSEPTTTTHFWRELSGIFVRFREVWSILGRKEKRLLVWSLLPMFLHAAAQNAIPVLAGRMVDDLRDSREAGTIGSQWWGIAVRFTLLIAVSALAREAFYLLRKRMVSFVTARVERNLTIGLVSHLFRQSLQSLSKDHVGTMHGRATRGIAGFIRFIRLAFREFLPAVMAVAIALIYAFAYRPTVGLLLLAALVAGLALVAIQLRAQHGMFAAIGASQEQLDGKVIEQLEGMEYIRAANTLELEVDRITRVADNRYACDTALTLKSTWFDVLKSLNEWVFFLAILIFTIYLAVTNKIEIGAIVTFLGLASNMTAPLRDMHRILDDGYETSGNLKDLMVIMDELLDPSFAVDPGQELTIVRRFGERRPPPPKIVFQEPKLDPAIPLFEAENVVVEFGAPAQVRRVLDGVSVRIGVGETVGFAGPSGSGKSTLLRVLLRLVPVASGTARFGGVPIHNVSRDAIGRLIGYVSQNPFVFSGSIAENIAYGCGKVTREAIQRAAEQAGIHTEILAMPGGYDAHLRERGTNISGGQRQRIAIARVFLKDPPILVLDEATSALDNVGEHVIQETIDRLRGDRTVLLVAHRLSTLRTADRILVFQHGRIVQSGTMDVLASEEGVFRELMKISEEE